MQSQKGGQKGWGVQQRCLTEYKKGACEVHIPEHTGICKHLHSNSI